MEIMRLIVIEYFNRLTALVCLPSLTRLKGISVPVRLYSGPDMCYIFTLFWPPSPEKPAPFWLLLSDWIQTIFFPIQQVNHFPFIEDRILYGCCSTLKGFRHGCSSLQWQYLTGIWMDGWVKTQNWHRCNLSLRCLSLLHNPFFSFCVCVLYDKYSRVEKGASKLEHCGNDIILLGY